MDHRRRACRALRKICTRRLDIMRRHWRKQRRAHITSYHLHDMDVRRQRCAKCVPHCFHRPVGSSAFIYHRNSHWLFRQHCEGYLSSQRKCPSISIHQFAIIAGDNPDHDPHGHFGPKPRSILPMRTWSRIHCYFERAFLFCTKEYSPQKPHNSAY